MNLVRKLIDLDRQTAKRICVIGDAMTDVYVHGRFAECQDDCPMFVETSRCSLPGGAANAAQQLDNWYCHTSLYALAGQFASLFAGSFAGISPTKTRYMIGSKIVWRTDLDEMLAHPQELADYLQYSLKEIAKADAVLISDYDKGFLTPELIRQVIALAAERGVPCVADAKREPELYAGAILKCNFPYSVKHVCPGDVCTNGADLPFIREMALKAPRLRPVRCISHVGAGDCFAAHLTLALAHGFTLEDAAAIAHSAGRVYVQHEHNRPPLPEEVAADFDGRVSLTEKLS